MPKGVEHIRIIRIVLPVGGVPRPLMPKGVEHHNHRGNLRAIPLVPRPLMPKGVEHYMTLDRITSLKMFRDL